VTNAQEKSKFLFMIMNSECREVGTGMLAYCFLSTELFFLPPSIPRSCGDIRLQRRVFAKDITG